jgi:hypothetical protein
MEVAFVEEYDGGKFKNLYIRGFVTWLPTRMSRLTVKIATLSSLVCLPRLKFGTDD